MYQYSSRAAAKRLGIKVSRLRRYIRAGQVPAPKITRIGRLRVHTWTEKDIERIRPLMHRTSTRQVARRLGISVFRLHRYIWAGKVPAPKSIVVGTYELHLWTEKDIERVQAAIQKLANAGKIQQPKKPGKQTARKPKR